jgi:hypothetical protein
VNRRTSSLVTALLALSLAANGVGLAVLLRARPPAGPPPLAAAEAPPVAAEPVAVRGPAPAPEPRTCATALAAADRDVAELRAGVARTGPAATAYRWSAPDPRQSGRWQSFLGKRARDLGLDEGAVTGDCHEHGCKLVASAELGGGSVAALESLTGSPVLRSCCSEIARGPSRAVPDALGGKPTLVAEYYVRLRPEFEGQ